jgi:hypothetical protein
MFVLLVLDEDGLLLDYGFVMLIASVANIVDCIIWIFSKYKLPIQMHNIIKY